MRIDPALAALRGDGAAQRRMRAAMERAREEWCAVPEIARLRGELGCYAGGERLDGLPALRDLTRSGEGARKLASQWGRHFARVLAREPLAQVPLRHHHSDGYSTMRLLSENGAALVLSVYTERADNPPARSVVFDDREMHEVVIAGAGHAALYRCAPTEDPRRVVISETPVALAPGTRIAVSGRFAARQIAGVAGRLVMLQLLRIPPEPGLTREYALPSGELLIQASGDKRASQREMAMAVLGAMGRSDAAEPIAALAHEGPGHSRWEAVRHTLALDPRRGMALLARIAADRTDPLRGEATRLHRELAQSHPQLAAMEDA